MPESKSPAPRKAERGVRKPLRQNQAGYEATMGELRQRASAGVKLRWFDDTTPGNKTMGCTLGLCDENLEPLMTGVYRAGGQHCPHDRRAFTQDGAPVPNGGDTSGCFHSCRIFKPQQRDDRQTAAARVLSVVAALLDARAEGRPNG